MRSSRSKDAGGEETNAKRQMEASRAKKGREWEIASTLVERGQLMSADDGEDSGWIGYSSSSYPSRILLLAPFNQRWWCYDEITLSSWSGSRKDTEFNHHFGRLCPLWPSAQLFFANSYPPFILLLPYSLSLSTAPTLPHDT